MPSSVGRPRKYHSAEEQRMAHAASSVRSYIRHKVQINKSCRRQYKRTKCPPEPSVSKDGPHPQQGTDPPASHIKLFTQRILKRISSKNEEFLVLIDRRPRVYAERLYREFMAMVTDQSPQGDDTRLCDELTKLGTLIQDVTNYADKILNDTGVGKDLAEAQEIQDCMREVEWWLEDILCGVLEGVDMLLNAHQSRHLLYQSSAS
ncbi:hypothetical protein EDD18DRAFT_1344301 [Armillaria luteobubalina]|uniref:Uncharacterized protein n=1 Tax=Armillaria luteobubalina TaxID=153913 RepID=A0AA39QPD3_9AGAR|nr:hypothetical protein EDD18DRAFT_1344301 [Armillaria luteobubalina]